jgi:predicted nuclease of predicted toxin-antitoxin system
VVFGARAIVTTLDADFHAILAVSRATAPSVIRIPIQGLDASAVVELVQRVIAGFADELSHGSLVTFKANKTTCHRLPTGGADLDGMRVYRE